MLWEISKMNIEIHEFLCSFFSLKKTFKYKCSVSMCVCGYNFLSNKHNPIHKCKCFPGGSVKKNLPANTGVHTSIPWWEDTLEKETTTQANIFAWEIPWTEEPASYCPWGSQRVRHDLVTKTTTNNTNMYTHRWG